MSKNNIQLSYTYIFENFINQTNTSGKIPSEACELNDTQPLITRLDQLRNEKAQFIQQKVSSPNPLLSYGVTLEFINKIPSESVKYSMTELVMEIWQKAIS